MRCGCPECGTYMIQCEHGLSSGCLCPNCSFYCNACMGTEQLPLDAQGLRSRMEALDQQDRQEYGRENN